MRVRNTHTAQIDDLAPGAEGEVDATRSGVQTLLKAGRLVPVDGAELPAGAPAPTAEDAAAMVRELEQRATAIEELRLRVQDLEKDVHEHAARGNALDAENARLRAELDEATKPIATETAAPEAPAPKGKGK